eukprot:jgi/Chlat1/5389/Chrsp35S05219
MAVAGGAEPGEGGAGGGGAGEGIGVKQVLSFPPVPALGEDEEQTAASAVRAAATAGVFEADSKLLPEFPVSACLLRVSYGDKEVRCGNELTLAEARPLPTSVSWRPADNGTLYTLVMLDPDAKSSRNRFMSPIIHWLVVNIRPDQAQVNQLQSIQKGDTLHPYSGPGPAVNSGPHRYIFFLLEQPNGPLQPSQVRQTFTPIVSRLRFHVHSFVKRFELKPVAVNFFQSRQDGSSTCCVM